MSDVHYDPIGTTTPPGGWKWTHEDFVASGENLTEVQTKVVGYIVANDIDVDDPRQEIIDQTAKALRKRDRDRYFRPLGTPGSGTAPAAPPSAKELTPPAAPPVEPDSVLSEDANEHVQAGSEEPTVGGPAATPSEPASTPIAERSPAPAPTPVPTPVPAPAPAEESAPNPDPIDPVKATLVGAKTVAKIASGGPYQFVSLGTAFRRALVCQGCPQNRPAGEFPSSLLESMGKTIIRNKREGAQKEGTIPKLPPATQADLGVCKVCKCALGDAVWFNAETHLEFVKEFGDRLPAKCWKKTECASL